MVSAAASFAEEGSDGAKSIGMIVNQQDLRFRLIKGGVFRGWCCDWSGLLFG